MRQKRKMRKLSTKIKAIFLAVVMFCAGTGLCSMQVYAAKGNTVKEAKNGVVSVQFYLKGAAFYITDGENFQWIQDLDSNGEGLWSSGSGFFIGSSGKDPMYIVTNNHVISDFLDADEGGNYFSYTGQTYNGYPVVVGAESCELRIYYDDDDYDTATLECSGDSEKVDLAVLKIRNPTDKRHALQIEVPSEDMVGETVYTVGFPGNAENFLTSASQYGLDDITVHQGVINKFVADAGRGVERIQIDATIQHGNSGGPLVTEEGYVIGVNTNVISNSPYDDQIEVDYYAINSSELVKFLDRNSIPYEMAGQGGSKFIVVIIALCAVFCAAGVIIVVSKKKKAASGQGAAHESKELASAQPQAAQRAFVRSMAAQHNGLALVVSGTPLLIGRDAANCKLVYAEGTAGVSGRHCSVSFDAGENIFIVTDLRSTYGTFLINGQKMNPDVPYRLKPGESFYVGDRANVISVGLG